LKIDPEFELLIPPLTDEEFNQLRDNILEDCEVREPLVTWNGIILDGHNRWKIIQENPGIHYKTIEMIFLSRNEAKAWMIRNQLGRRNLPNYERARLALQLKPLLAEEASKRMKAGKADPTKKSAEGEVREQLAKAAGVSHDTISKVEKIEAKATPEVKEQLRKGELSINKAYSEIKEVERKEEPIPIAEEKPKQPEYTFENLLQEISASCDNYVKFVRDTLVKRSTMYADSDKKQRVLEAIVNVRTRIEEIEKILK